MPPDQSAHRSSALFTRLRPAQGLPQRELVAVHPGALPARVWDSLAQALPPNTGVSLLDLQQIPEFALAAVQSATEPVLGVPELARRCRAELDAHLPPDHDVQLVGWSFGGVVAYEMTVQLTAAGQAGRLRDLVLLDSIAPVEGFKRPDELLEPGMVLGWFAMYLGARQHHSFAAELPPATDDEEGLRALLRAATDAGVLPPDVELAGLRKLFGAYRGGLSRNNRCVNPYDPAPLSRPITLAKAERSLLPRTADLGWGSLARHGLRQLTVPGDHYTMLQDPAAVDALSLLLAAPAAV